MPVQSIYTFMVHPKRQEDAENINGNVVPMEGKLFALLRDIYEKSERECDIDIAFNPSADGEQVNACRDTIREFVRNPTIDTGRAIAHRLGRVSTGRSGLGLLFLIKGMEGDDHKLIISRFPADSAILAEERQEELSVEFLERVFMKSAHSYKAAMYKHRSLDAGFWIGRAIDKQISNPAVQASRYWISEFLESDFRTTPAAGTRRLAVMLKNAARASQDVNVKTEIAAAVTLANNLRREPISVAEFQERFGLSEAAIRAIGAVAKTPASITERFTFDPEEFSRHVAFRSVQLDTGVILAAPTDEFDTLLHQERAAGGRFRFSTEGAVVNDKVGAVPVRS